MTRARLNELLKRMAKTRVLIVGDLILDEFIWGSVERISPEAPVPVVWLERESAMPGGAANVACSGCCPASVRLLQPPAPWRCCSIHRWFPASPTRRKRWS